MPKPLLKFKGWLYEDEVRLFARLDGTQGGFSYFDLGDKLILRQVIAGVRCTVSQKKIDECLRTYSTPVEILRARGVTLQSYKRARSATWRYAKSPALLKPSPPIRSII